MERTAPLAAPASGRPLRRLRRVGLTGCAAVAAGALLAGCGAGSGATTSQTFNPAEGVNLNVPADVTPTPGANFLAVRNVIILVNPDYPTDGQLVMTVVNNNLFGENGQQGQPDTLLSVTVDGKPVDVPGAPVTIAPSKAWSVGSMGSPAIGVKGIGAKVGQFVPVVLTFANAGTVPVDDVPVASTASDQFAPAG